MIKITPGDTKNLERFYQLPVYDNNFFKLLLLNWYLAQVEGLNKAKLPVKVSLDIKIDEISDPNVIVAQIVRYFASKNRMVTEDEIKKILSNDNLGSLVLEAFIDLDTLDDHQSAIFNNKILTRGDLELLYKMEQSPNLTRDEVIELLVTAANLSNDPTPALNNYKIADLSKLKVGEEQSNNLKFVKLLSKLQKQYDVNPLIPKERKIYINENDIKLLSRYEKNVIRAISNIYGIMNDPSQDITFDVLQRVMSALGQFKSDNEKSYLLGIFFPEKVKNVHKLNPFPLPTYTFNQQFQIFIKPNSSGNFLAQLVCPYFIDTTVAGKSNLWVNTNDALDGITTGLDTHFTAQTQTRVPAGVFNNSVLLFAKLSARYIGRSDIESGYFGAGVTLSTKASNLADEKTTNFDVINRGIHGTVSALSYGLNVVYYPADYSYLNFIATNSDPVTNKTMSTSMRLNLYGSSLPPSTVAQTAISASVVLTCTLVWNTLPTADYSDLLPLDYNIEDQNLELQKLASFVPASNLGTFSGLEAGKIETAITRLPTPALKKAVDDYNVQKPFMEGKHNLLSVMDLDNPEKFVISKQMIYESSTDKKEKSINALNRSLK